MADPTINQYSTNESLRVLGDLTSNKKVEPSKLQSVTASITQFVTDSGTTLEKKEWAAVQLYLVSQKAQSALDQLDSKKSPKLEQHRQNLQAISNAFNSVVSKSPSPATSVSRVPNPENWTANQAEEYKISFSQVQFDHDSQMTTLPPTLVMESYVDSIVSKDCGKKLLQEYAIKSKSNEKATPTQSLTGIWFASRPEKQQKTFKFVSHNNQVTPNLQSPIAPSKDLTNVHYQKSGDTYIVTSGAIDTIDKAKQLLATFKEAEAGKQPEKLLMLQLDSAYVDSNAIHNQHVASEFLKRQLVKKDAPTQLSHINLCLSGYSQMPGRFEDNFSRAQNIDGLATLRTWVDTLALSTINPQTEKKFNRREWTDSFSHDLNDATERFTVTEGKINDLKKQCDDIQNNLKSFSSAEATIQKAKLKDLQHQIAVFEKDSSDLSSQIQNLLSAAAIDSTYKADQLETLNEPKLQPLITALRIVSSLIDNKSSISRTTEVELTLLLSKLINANLSLSNTNGLDETGFAKALLEGQDALIKKFIEDGLSPDQAITATYNLILKMDQYSKDLDALTLPLLTAESKSVISDLNNFENTPPSDLHLKIKAEIDSHKNQDLRYAWFYKQHIAASLFKTAMPAAIEGTGLPGLNFGFDTDSKSPYASNSHLLARLPSHIITTDDLNATKTIQLYSKGTILHSRWPTNAGAALIFRDSKLRLNDNNK